jgi:putative sterol carrier protein
MMADRTELREALEDYRLRCNENPRLRTMLRSWSRTCDFRSLDTDASFTVSINAGEITAIDEGPHTSPDIVISATSEDLADMFWGDLNPAAKYLSGDIKVVGSQADVLRVDAMAALIWAD